MNNVRASLLIIAALCVLPNIAHAQIRRTQVQGRDSALELEGNCTRMLNDFISYTNQPPFASEKRWIDFQLVMTQREMSSEYIVGKFSYYAYPVGEKTYPGLHGEGKQYFSERVWAARDFPSPEGNPFNPAKTDNLWVDIDSERPHQKGVSVYFNGLHASEGTGFSSPQCSSAFMYGFAGEWMYTFSFKKGGYQIH